MPADIDWDKLTFSLTPINTMYLSTTAINQPWQPGKLQPFKNISISPAAGIFNYGQGIFEGMKAHRTKNDDIVLFRPEANARRFAHSAAAVAIPPIPEDIFLEGVRAVVKDNQEFIPPYGKGALYLRPIAIGTGQLLGNAPAPEYTFIVFASPVGNYFAKGLSPIRTKIATDYHRAAPHGTGHAKFCGNYPGCYPSTLQAKKEGFAVCIYLDAAETKYIEEAGAANIFFRFGNTIKTPQLGAILPGITRDSVIQLIRNQLGLEVEETQISVEEALTADEVFCTGTAAIVTPIGSIHYKDNETIFCNNEVGEVTRQVYDLYRAIQLCEQEDPYQWVVKL
ncbi:MAG: branched-chain amino acid aminotransferase [Coxiellaceae bacterium]|nr:branched-chain amino acid aminotransferase [Coxiellaceae bacterium]